MQTTATTSPKVNIPNRRCRATLNNLSNKLKTLCFTLVALSLPIGDLLRFTYLGSFLGVTSSSNPLISTAYANLTSVASATSASSTAGANLESDNTEQAYCPNSRLLSPQLLTNICWSCMLPLRIAKITVGATLASDAPPEAVDQAFCSCRGEKEGPWVGYTLGFWQPLRLIELVRTPGCLTSLNGARVNLGNSSQLGTLGNGSAGLDNLAFYHYHYYSFPLLQIIGLFSKDICASNDFVSMDMLYASELDPTWSYPEISSLTFPETEIFASDTAILACAADTIKNLGQGTSAGMFWCAGSWGTVYPVTGFTGGVGSSARVTSLLATRALAASHRRGFERQTAGSDALCSLNRQFTFVPQQYRMSMLYPMPQNSKHPIGKSTFTWGEASNATDAIYLVWRWRDCCSATLLPSLP